MKRSANEISALVQKAARGAQLPLAVAEDLGRLAPGLDSDALGALAEAMSDPQRHAGLNGICLDLEMGEDTTDCAESEILAALRENRPVAPPYDVSDRVWAVLEALAHRTYVPESEASRQSGAGAGAIDND